LSKLSKKSTDSKCIPIIKNILLGLVIALSITAVVGLSLLLAGVPVVVLGAAVAAIALGCGTSSTVVASVALGVFALIGIGATAYGCCGKKKEKEMFLDDLNPPIPADSEPDASDDADEAGVNLAVLAVSSGADSDSDSDLKDL